METAAVAAATRAISVSAFPLCPSNDHQIKSNMHFPNYPLSSTLPIDNGSSDRSNRSSLSAGSCGSGSGSGYGIGGPSSGKRNSSNLYINNPNSLEVEQHNSCNNNNATSLDCNGGGNGVATGHTTTAAAFHHQLHQHQHHQHYHFTNYDYGPGPNGGGQPGVAHLVIGNARLLASTANPPDGSAASSSSGNIIPRSVSVPLSRSNSRKDSVSLKLRHLLCFCGGVIM